MRHTKHTTIRIYDDHATEMAQQLIDKCDESNPGNIYREGGEDALRKTIADEMEPICADASEITAVLLVLEIYLDGYRYLPPAQGKILKNITY